MGEESNQQFKIGANLAPAVIAGDRSPAAAGRMLMETALTGGNLLLEGFGDILRFILFIGGIDEWAFEACA